MDRACFKEQRSRSRQPQEDAGEILGGEVGEQGDGRGGQGLAVAVEDGAAGEQGVLDVLRYVSFFDGNSFFNRKLGEHGLTVIGVKLCNLWRSVCCQS